MEKNIYYSDVVHAILSIPLLFVADTFQSAEIFISHYAFLYTNHALQCTLCQQNYLNNRSLLYIHIKGYRFSDHM